MEGTAPAPAVEAPVAAPAPAPAPAAAPAVEAVETFADGGTLKENKYLMYLMFGLAAAALGYTIYYYRKKLIAIDKGYTDFNALSSRVSNLENKLKAKPNQQRRATF
jgi:hypothetical protein